MAQHGGWAKHVRIGRLTSDCHFTELVHLPACVPLLVPAVFSRVSPCAWEREGGGGGGGLEEEKQWGGIGRERERRVGEEGGRGGGGGCGCLVYCPVYGSLQTNWDQVVESFDDMKLRDELLRGIYAYG